MTYTLADLPYSYDALEPHIDARTMEIHHSKHHAGYTAKANKSLQGTPWGGKEPCDILTQLDQIPADIRTAVTDNVGGYCNHNFFWAIMSPDGGGVPVGDLAEAIDSTFGSFEAFQAEFAAAAGTRFGSGWAWLVIRDGDLSIISTANQDSPLSLGYRRVLGIDVWEHAYYLHYQNRRPDYVTAFWNVVNWEQANEFYQKGGV